MQNLLQKEVLILDGGLGTTLEDNYGVKFSQETPLWSSHLLISDPETLLRAQTAFVDAGADIILTPTYQASNEGFRKTGIGNASPYLIDAVRIAANACKDRAVVALSLGAYGATMQPSQEYTGNYDIDEAGLVRFHAQRLAEFEPCWDQISLVAFETLPKLSEVRAVKEAYSQSTPYWISCVFPDGDRLPDGTSIEELVTVMMGGRRPWAIGLNCTKVYKAADIILAFEAAAEKLGLHLPRLVVYPDGTAGQVYDTTLQKWIGEEHEDAPWGLQVASIVEDVKRRGRWEGIVVGGCCKAAPKHIHDIKRRISPGS